MCHMDHWQAGSHGSTPMLLQGSGRGGAACSGRGLRARAGRCQTCWAAYAGRPLRRCLLGSLDSRDEVGVGDEALGALCCKHGTAALAAVPTRLPRPAHTCRRAAPVRRHDGSASRTRTGRGWRSPAAAAGQEGSPAAAGWEGGAGAQAQAQRSDGRDAAESPAPTAGHAACTQKACQTKRGMTSRAAAAHLETGLPDARAAEAGGNQARGRERAPAGKAHC